jgi:hypothetical protein
MADPAPDPYGRSLALVDGDLVVDRGSGGLTLREIEGEPNLLQALQLRVLTPLGTDRFNIAYGLDTGQIFTAGGGVRMTKDLIRLNLVRTLGTDRRVRDVKDIVFMDDEEYRLLHALTEEDIRLARIRRTWAVDVVLELVPAGDLVLALEVSA